MPGLILFGRRWSVGSDDFVYPNLLEIILRLPWMIAVSVVFHLNREEFTCEGAVSLKIYYIGLIVIQILSILEALAIMIVSMKGTIIESFKREKIHVLLYLKLCVLTPDCAWVILGTYLAFGYTFDCPSIVIWMVKGAVICSWIVGISVLIVLLLIFDPMGRYRFHKANRKAKKVSDNQNYHSDVAIRTWERRCRFICCCVAKNDQNKDVFTEISKLVAEFFEDVDLVPTDIAAGLILIQRKQMKEAKQKSTLNIYSPSQNEIQYDISKVIPRPQKWMTIRLMRHYMTFAAASYGWPLYVYDNLCTGLCRILRKSRCCACLRKEDHIVSDNACSCNTAGILTQAQLERKDLIYVSYHDEIAEIPFFVAVDRKEKKVVISIRGTLSLEDALTDLSAAGEELAVPGIEDCKVHSGMLKCAKYIESQLKKLQLLEKAFDAAPEANGLVLTGHSLGAGTAAVLAIMLKSTYPDLICFAFSPPGGLLSPTASQHAQDYICSVILGKDVIPRLGMFTMNKLKDQILDSLTKCQQPKYKILASGCFRFCCECLSKEPKLNESRPIESPGVEHNNSQASLRINLVNPNNISTTLEWPAHPPGQILYVTEEENRDCCGKSTYAASWAQPDDFNEVLISSHMVSDHMPECVLESLSYLESVQFIPFQSSTDV